MKDNKDIEKVVTSDEKSDVKSKKKPSKFGAFFTSKKTKRGGVALLLTIIFIAAVVGLNILATMLTNREFTSSLTIRLNR